MKKKIVVFAAVCVLGITTLTGCSTTEEADGQRATVTTASEVAQMDDPDAVKADASLEKPSFTVDLSGSVSARMNEEASPLTVEATVTNGGTVTYQWYRNTVNSNGGGTPIEGATEATCVPELTEEGITYYYVVATNTLDKSMSKEKSQLEIRKEYVKEFWGEGQLWYYYKRNSIMDFSEHMKDVSYFTFKIPDVEESTAGRQ